MSEPMLRQQVRLYLLQLQDHTPSIPTAWTRAAVVMRRCLKRTVVRQLFRLLERQAPTRVTARRHVG